MKKFVVYIALLFTVYACIEPFEFETRDAAGILVVEASITDKLQKHVVVLSRAANLENVNVKVRDTLDITGPITKIIRERVNPENGASVKLTDSEGNTFNFEDSGEGEYVSADAFALANNTAYQLLISTSNNETYESGFEAVQGKSEISELYAERGFNENGKEGMLIYLNGADTQGQSDYFRYEYEETYKIIVPNFTGKKLEIIREEQETLSDFTVLYPDARVVVNTDQQQICYNGTSNTDINLVNTNVLAAPELERHVVRFLDRDNTIISHRYSILSKQFVINSAAYNYYQNLSDFAQSESVFSEIQPGFLEGNIRRTDVEDGLVLGYFEVASVSERRLFFNYSDFFPNEPLPPYFGNISCNRPIAPSLDNPLRDGPQPLGCEHPPSLIRRVKSNEIDYLGENLVPGECEGPYLMTPSICADCTLLGDNIKPEFWVD